MNINYEAEVKKVYPDAECRTAQQTAMKVIFTANGSISERCDTELEAWHSAWAFLCIN